jgi:deoxyhypusine synthase
MLPRESKLGRIFEDDEEPSLSNISIFLKRNFHHFNARELVDAAEAYVELIDKGGKMFVAMAGAMSTAEIGISLAPMIREGKVHAICCTGANLEEDVFNLVAHDSYVDIRNWRELKPTEEKKLMDKHINRVTDVGIPEQEAMTPIESAIIQLWKSAKGTYFPHEYLYDLILTGKLEKYYEIDPEDSWMVAAAEANLPIYVPGWEDSTLGNVFAAMCIKGTTRLDKVRGGIEYMMHLVDWYKKQSKVGFFQIGGGIAGDFPICVVPLIQQDLKEDAPLWAYFCQIRNCSTSYGSYSGALPNEKITWGKIGPTTPAFDIESDATIAVPLIFNHVLGL